ncbi:MAG TPA: hypothetical protein VLZ83_07390 [Edaphocola sp.]|nr:hypothetical protein [Edaphocola sp.]
MMTILLTSCSQKITFLNSSVVPGAEGYVKVKKDNNKNYIIEVEVTDLAEVGKVHATNNSYVLWMETDQGNAENLGQLKSSTSFFSKRHSASLETASSYKPIKFFITTEEGINVQYPGDQIVLTTEKFNGK